MGISGQIVQPAEARHTSFTDGSGLRVDIPSPKKWFLIAFTGIFLAFWLILEISGIGFFITLYMTLVVNPEINVSPFWVGNLFIVLWLAILTILGVYAVFLFLWQLRGREVVQVEESIISLRKEIFATVGKTKLYSREHIKDFRIAPYVPASFGLNRSRSYYGLVGGFLAFDYGAKTIHFGAGVDEAEAKHIYQKIIEQFPQYGSPLS